MGIKNPMIVFYTKTIKRKALKPIHVDFLVQSIMYNVEIP